MPNVSRDSSFKMSSPPVSGAGTGSITGVTTTASSGLIQVWVANGNSSAGASGTTAPTVSGGTGSGGVGTFTKTQNQIDGTSCLDLWEATYSGAPLSGCTITISSMPVNTSQWAMMACVYANATGKSDAFTKQIQHTQNGNSPSVTTGANNDLVATMFFANNGPTGSAIVGTGFTADPNNASNGIGTYGYFSLGTANAVTATAGTVVTPTWTTQGGIGNPGIQMTVSIPGASAPVAPAAPTVSSITTTGSQVNPGALTSGATSCNIQVTTAADSTFATPVATITGATAGSNNAITGLTAGTNYIYRTQMVNGSGTTNGPATSTTPTLFTAPTALAVTAVANSTQLALGWTAPSGNAAITYNVLRSTTNGSGYSQVATGVATNSWTDNTGLAGSTNYYYVVQAVDSSGSSANSAQGTGITLTCPAAPTSVLGTPSTGGTPQVALTWTGSSGATGYNVYRSTSLGGSYTLVTGGGNVQGGTAFTDQTVSSGQAYYYKVSALNASGESALSSPSSQEFVGVPSPTGLSASYVTSTGVNLSWTAPAGFTGTGYKIYRLSNAVVQMNGVPHRLDNETPYAIVPWGTTTFTDRKMGLPVLSGGSTFTYYVTTMSGANESALSTASAPVTFNG